MKKKITSILLFTAMLISAMPLVITSAAEDITISTAAELKAFADSVNAGDTYEGKTVSLTADIDLSKICGADIDGEEISWTPIGSDDSFSGIFDGNGHTISGLYINSEDIAFAGLFGFCDESSRILNLVVDGSVKAGYPSVGGWANPPIEMGGIAAASAGKIANCHNKAAITGIGNGAFAAGICGMGLSAVIENCINTGVIVSEFESAAMVTWMGSSATDNCYYLEGTSVDGGGAQVKTAEQFASGEVAYLLGSPWSLWGQKIGVDKYPVIGGDKVYPADDGFSNTPAKVVTVEPPTVNIESGEVPYGTKVTISPTNGNDFEYSVNGEQFVNSRLMNGLGDAVITITEDTVLVVRSMIDAVEADTEYIFPEATYTYTIGGSVVPISYYIRYYQGRPTHDVDFLPEDNLKLDYVFINSLNELQERWQGEASLIKAYGGTFFDEHSLLIISWQEGQSTRTHKVPDIIFSGNNGIDVTFASFFNDELAADVMTDYSAAVEIPKYYSNSKVRINQINEQTITYPYKISGLRITNTKGEEMEQIPNNTSFIVEADIVKTEERNEKDCLFVAVYDTDGALLSLDYVKAKFTVDGECSFGFSIPPQEKPVGSVKAFVWNTFNSTEPLAENKTLSFTE